jgi:hypothetical protein
MKPRPQEATQGAWLVIGSASADGKLPADAAAYFRELLIEVNMLLRFVPRPFTVAMIAIEIPAAISPYSMAVAPESFRQKPKTNFFIILPSISTLGTDGAACLF